MSGDDLADRFRSAAALHQAGRLAEAVDAYLDISRRVVTSNLALQLGRALLALGRFDEAAHWLQLAIPHLPETSARLDLASALSSGGKVAEAERELRAALASGDRADEVRLALGALLLSVGRYPEGWPLMEARIALHPDTVPPVETPWPEWQGEALSGKSILVWYEQGLGDQIQMCRFAADLKARGAARVTLGCRPGLATLLATAPGVDAVLEVPLGQPVRVPTHDYWSRYFSLPARLGVTLETLPAAPYLSVPADRRGARKPPARVGLAWKASPTGFNAAHKGLPPDQAQRLFDLGAMSLDPADTGVADFADTAAIIDQLDLVISIDTSVAHLAGALGKRCWTFIPRVGTDWRWLRDRTDSPWYPAMRLYRQRTPGDWTEAIDEVIGDLGRAGLPG